MEKLITEITSLSSKGQIVLPKNIRESLSLDIGDKFMVFTDKDNILLKPIKQINMNEFDKLMKISEEWAFSVGMKEKDIKETIKVARKRK